MVVQSFWAGSAADWFAGAGTLALALVTVYQEWFRRRVFRPKLKLEVGKAPPDCHKTKWTGLNCSVYYLRLLVTNTGNETARDVQVYLSSVERQALNGSYIPVKSFLPMNLLWAHVRKPTLPELLPGMPHRHCDFAHITDPKYKQSLNEVLPEVPGDVPVLALDLEVLSNTLGHLLERGNYLLKLKLAAANQSPMDYRLKIQFKGLWFEDESRMLSDGIGMEILER